MDDIKTNKAKFVLLKISITIFLVTVSFASFADFETYQFHASLGMVNASYAESPSSLQAEQSTGSTAPAKSTEAAAGSASIMPLEIEIERFTEPTSSWFLKGIAPILPSATGNYMFLGLGKNFYIKSIGAKGTYKSADQTLVILPKWRFYAGGGLGLNYLVYYTKTAKKTDVQMELFGQGGTIHNIDEKWGIKVEGGFARGVGVSTSSTTIKLFAGATMFWD